MSASFPMCCILLVVSFTTLFAASASAQDCTNKTTTFLLLTNAKLEEPSPSDSMLTFNLTSCIEGCYQNARCMAVNIESNPKNAFCQYFRYSMASRAQDAVPNEWPVQPMSIYYLQKTCLKGACARTFSFELAAGYDLVGHELMLIRNSTEGHCMETCLASRQTFGVRCLSFTYSLATQECHINGESRFTRPGDFVRTNSTLVRYYDNHCEDEMSRQLDMNLAAMLAGSNATTNELMTMTPPRPTFDVLRKDTAMRFTDTDYTNVDVHECEALCLNNKDYICRSFIYGSTQLGLFCGLSHHTTASLRYVPHSVFPMNGVSIYQRRLDAIDAGDGAAPSSSTATDLAAVDALVAELMSGNPSITTTTMSPPQVVVQEMSTTTSATTTTTQQPTMAAATTRPNFLQTATLPAAINITAPGRTTTSNDVAAAIRRKNTTTATALQKRQQQQQQQAIKTASGAGGSSSGNASSAGVSGFELADAMINELLSTDSTQQTDCWPTMLLQSGKTVSLNAYRTTPQYTASECLAECERDQACTAMQIDYSNAECAFYNRTTSGGGDGGDLANVSMREYGMGNYYEKVCFDRRRSSQAQHCAAKDWSFEVLRGKTLESLDLQGGIYNVVQNVPNREQCLMECLLMIKTSAERNICKTVEYNARSGTCRLSKLDRYSRTLNSIGLRKKQQSILRSRESRQLQLMQLAGGESAPMTTNGPANTTTTTSATAQNVGDQLHPDTTVYESNCFSEPRQFCTFDKVEGFDISLVDKTVMEGVKSEEDCRQLCLQETAFNCRTYSLISQFACMLSHHIMENAPPAAIVAGPKDAISHFQVKNCYNVTVECMPAAMRALVETNRIFGGLMYSRGHSATCTKHVEDAYSFFVDLPLPNQPDALLCGTSVQQQRKGDNATWYSNTVILQHNDHVVTSSDHAINVKCRYEQTKKTLLIHEGPLVRNTSHAISDTIVREDIFRWGEAQLPVPRMEVLDRSGKEMLEADLGDQMIVRISFTAPTSVYSVQATDLVARDSVGINNMTLIDGDGCIVENAIVKEVRKPRSDMFEIVLEVFAFPEDDTLVLEVIAETCHGTCPTAGTCLPDQITTPARPGALLSPRQARLYPAAWTLKKRDKRSSFNDDVTDGGRRQARRVENSGGSGFVQFLAHDGGDAHSVIESALLPASSPSNDGLSGEGRASRFRRSSSTSGEQHEDEEDGNNADQPNLAVKTGSNNTKLHEQQTTRHQRVVKVRNSRFDLPAASSDSSTVVAALQVPQATYITSCVSAQTFGVVLIGCALILLTVLGVCMVLCLRYNTIRRALIKAGGGGSSAVATSLYSTPPTAATTGSASSRSAAMSSSFSSPSSAASSSQSALTLDRNGNLMAASGSSGAASLFTKVLETCPNSGAACSSFGGSAAVAGSGGVRNQQQLLLRQQQSHNVESDYYLATERARIYTQSHC